MGACDFKCFGVGRDLTDAYRNAVDEARYEHGNDSYNGTISTTLGVKVDASAPKFGTKAFTEYLNKAFAMDRLPKWECYAVELTGKALKEYRARHGLQRKRVRVFFFFGLASC